MLPPKEATCEQVCNGVDIFSIEEVRRISTRFLEQAVLVLYDENLNIRVLCGPCCSKTCAMAPSMCSIINAIDNYRVPFKDALVVHNHPTLPWHGEVVPSEDDIAATELLKWQLALLGIKLIDHIIITGHKRRALSEKGICIDRGFHANGFEIKRFMYSFFVQIALVLEHEETLDVINELLAQNLELLSNYYEKHYWARLFAQRPVDFDFLTRLGKLYTGDTLLDRLIDLLSNLEDGKKVKLQPKVVIPYGQEFQKRIISGEYRVCGCAYN